MAGKNYKNDTNKKSHPKKKICFCLQFFQRGGGGCPVRIQIFQVTFLFCSFLDIFQKGGEFVLFHIFGGTSLLEFGCFSLYVWPTTRCTLYTEFFILMYTAVH